MKKELDDQIYPASAHRQGVSERKQFNSHLNELGAVRAFVYHICKVAKFDSNAFITEIELCIHEAVANIIQHAYKMMSDRPIIIDCTYEEAKCLHVDIYDLGTAFTPQESQFSELPSEAESGRGLFLMHVLSEGLEFHPKKQEGEWNHLYLFKSYPGKN